MEYYVGLDVSVKETAICVVDRDGGIVREARLETEPETVAGFLHGAGLRIARVGLEAGPLSSWLYAGLEAAGFKVVFVEARHMQAALSAMRNKMGCPGLEPAAPSPGQCAKLLVLLTR